MKERISYRNNHYRTVDDVINAVKRIGSVNGYRTYVNDDEKMDNIIDFMFQHGERDSVFRIMINLDEVKDWRDMYNAIDNNLKNYNCGSSFRYYDLYVPIRNPYTDHWLKDKAKEYLNGFYGTKAFERQYEREYEKIIEYCKNDVNFTKQLLGITSPYKKPQTKPTITNVIFNDPATIVFWSDGDKTVMKAHENDIFDPEKGLAMAIYKKLLGNNEGKYYDEFKKWLPEEEKETPLSIYFDMEKFKSNIVKYTEEFKKNCDRILSGDSKKFEEKESTPHKCETCRFYYDLFYEPLCEHCCLYSNWEPQEGK